jgi:heptosyltransferase-3
VSKAREFARQFYWAVRRNKPSPLHILKVLPAFLSNALKLIRRRSFSRQRRKWVAIALLEHMGDIVAAEPIARLARRRFPDAEIWWITRATYQSLPASYADVDEVLNVGCLTEWILLRQLKLFDETWDLHLDGRTCPKCCIPLIRSAGLPKQENYYDFGSLLDVRCDCAGITRLGEGPIILPSAAAVTRTNALSLPPHFVAIHCMSNDPLRDWPEIKWRELITRILPATGLPIVEVGLQTLVVRPDDTWGQTFCGMLSIMETAEVIRRATLFIGIDSGPAHLANAVGTPGIVLLGDYAGFRFYTPYDGGYANGNNADIARADGPVECLSVDTVVELVEKRLSITSGSFPSLQV